MKGPRSFESVYRRYHQSLYRYCFSILGNPEDAQDALQNAMLKAMRALPGEKREIKLKPWLYRIAHNESIELLRKRRDEARVSPELVAPGAGPAETAAQRERLRRLLDDLSELPDRQRAALVMRELSGFGFKEIGEAFGASAAAARQTVYEARLGLRRLEAGREMSCDEVMHRLSNADGRVTRSREIRAHLRSCPDCRAFGEAIEGRRRDLAAIAPLPAIASAGILQALLGSTGAHAGVGLTGSVGAGAGKVVATSAVAKSVATVAVVAAVGVTAADRSGLVDAGLPGGNGAAATSSQTTPAGGSSGGASQSASTTGDANRGSEAGGAAIHPAAHGKKGAAKTAKAKAGGDEPGASEAHGPGSLPAASQHGQDTAAEHKASPNHGASHSHGHAAAGPHSSHKGSAHSHSSHSAHGASHSHVGSGQGASPLPNPPLPKQPSQPSPAPAPNETQSGETEAATGQGGSLGGQKGQSSP